MTEMKSPENVKKARIRTSVAKIIVEGRGGRDYYSILYLDPSDGKLHIGFSSSNLKQMTGRHSTHIKNLSTS